VDNARERDFKRCYVDIFHDIVVRPEADKSFSSLSFASASFSSVAQREIRIYLAPFSPKMNPGVMKT